MRRSGWIWGGRVAALVVLAGLTVHLTSVGLDKADKLASVLGLLVAAAGLVAPYLVPSSEESHPEPGYVQRIANTIVEGHLTQARKTKDVRVGGSGTSGPSQATPPSRDPSPEGKSGQYVNGVWVGGNLTQVDGVDGDITIG